MSEQHCINCGLNLACIQSYPLEQGEILTVVQQWVAPRQVSAGNTICHNCWEVVTASLITVKVEPDIELDIEPDPAEPDIDLVIEPDPEEPVIKPDPEEPDIKPDPEELNRCIGCGRSILRLRSHLLRTEISKENLIRNIIKKWIKPDKIFSYSRVCHPCWQRAHREAQRAKQPTVTNNTIILPSYTRAVNTQRFCIFPNCRSGQRITIPTSLRIRLLRDLSFYVPQNCRICNLHLQSNTWNDLLNAENEIHSFTATYIEDMASMLKTNIGNTIDFEKIEDIDDHLVNYLLGISKEQFRVILQQVPRLNSMRRGSTGLAAFLIKLRTGDSDQSLSTLFKTPRSTLERIMSKAKDILNQDFVPEDKNLLQHLGIK